MHFFSNKTFCFAYMFTSLQPSSSLPLLMNYCVSWRITATFCSVEYCKNIGRNMYHVTQMHVYVHLYAHERKIATHLLKHCSIALLVLQKLYRVPLICKVQSRKNKVQVLCNLSKCTQLLYIPPLHIFQQNPVGRSTASPLHP